MCSRPGFVPEIDNFESMVILFKHLLASPSSVKIRRCQNTRYPSHIRNLDQGRILKMKMIGPQYVEVGFLGMILKRALEN